VCSSDLLLCATSFLATLNEFLPLIGLFLALLWIWLAIGWTFKISFGKSIKAWLPVLVLQLPLILFLALILLPIHHSSEYLLRSKASASNLKGISRGLAIYTAENYDVYPPSFDKLIENGFITEETLHYPNPSFFASKSRSYFYLPPKKKGEEVDSSIIIVCEKKNLDKHVDGRNVLFAGGRVEYFSPEDFAAALAEPHNAAFAAALKQAEGP